jgi:hypothetical protein
VSLSAQVDDSAAKQVELNRHFSSHGSVNNTGDLVSYPEILGGGFSNAAEGLMLGVGKQFSG